MGLFGVFCGMIIFLVWLFFKFLSFFFLIGLGLLGFFLFKGFLFVGVLVFVLSMGELVEEVMVFIDLD